MSQARLFAVIFIWLPLFSLLAAQEARDEDVAKALDFPVDVDLRGAHLQDLISDLREQHGIGLRLDTRVLDEAGIETDKVKALASHATELRQLALRLRRQLRQLDVRLPPEHQLFARVKQLPFPGADFAAEGIPLRAALHHALAAWDPSLTFDVRDEEITATTLEAEEGSLITRVYEVRRLVRIPTDGQDKLFDPIGEIAGGQYDYDTLIDLLTSVVAPDSWADVGGSGSVAAGKGTLTIAQTFRNHELIRALFTNLEALHQRRVQTPDDTTAVWIYDSKASATQTRSVLDALSSEHTFTLRDVPLATLIESLRQSLQIPIRIDYRALDEMRVSVWSPISYEAPETSVGAGLQSLLEKLDPSLTYVVDYGVVVVTSREVEEETLQLRLYPIWDLVRNTTAAPSGSGGWDHDGLIDNITSSVAAESWDDVGGSASIEVEPIVGALAVKQTRRGHQQVEELIDEFRRVAARQRSEEPVAADVARGEYLTVVYRLWQPYSEKAIVKEDDIVKLLSEMIDAESWDAEEVFVRTLPSRLIIRQKKSVHRQVYQTLQNLAILKPVDETSPAASDQTVGAGGMGGGFMGGGMGGGFGGSAAAGALPPGAP